MSSRLPLTTRSGAALVLALALLALSGCGATGLDWVGEAHLDYSASRSRATSSTHVTPPQAFPAAAEQEPATDSRPRLSRTVTLGEVEVVGPGAQSRGSAPAAGSGVSVTVNNYNSNHVTPSYGYAGFGYARSAPSFSAGSAFSAGNAQRSSVSGPQPGQDWPAIADHGTSFPYRSAPASPWARTQ